MELYLHIPFCVKKCDYCDFLSMRAGDMVKKTYMLALRKEVYLQSLHYKGVPVTSVFIGGGTPSAVDAEGICTILEDIRRYYALSKDCEISIEVNPGTVDEEKLKAYHSAGVNRLSIGLQSMRNAELKLLGRVHTYEDFLGAFEAARKVGYQNINVDLMFGLPGQTVDSFRTTLKRILLYRPEHLSIYGLIIEEGTPFYERFRADEEARERGEEPMLLPTEEAERAMYMAAGQMCAKAGYERYEISNYAKPGFACRHNIGYWQGEEYIGMGLGASSYIGKTRYKNTSDLTEYFHLFDTHPDATDTVFLRTEVVHLNKRDEMEEFMFLGLRMMEGVSRRDFLDRFGNDIEAFYGDVMARLVQAGLLATQGGRVYLTEAGIDISNRVFAEFLLPDPSRTE